MRLLILLLVSWNVHAQCIGFVEAPKGLSTEEQIAFYDERDKERAQCTRWAIREAVRVIRKYPQLAMVYESHPDRFKYMLRVLKDEGKRMEDVIRITPASRPAHVRELLGDRV